MREETRSMEIKAGMVKELRDRTGAGMMQCKKALAEAEGDMEKATEAIRKMGLASLAKRAERAAGEGRVEAYIHPGNRLGALVEVNCETDFVARTEDFVHLCREVAMQVTATGPTYVHVEDVPSERIEEQKREARSRLADEGLSGEGLEARLAKDLDAYLSETVLMQQPYIRDAGTTMAQMVEGIAAKLGEKVRVSRFSYFRLGGNQ
jgi:elongation factor Ts